MTNNVAFINAGAHIKTAHTETASGQVGPIQAIRASHVRHIPGMDMQDADIWLMKHGTRNQSPIGIQKGSVCMPEYAGMQVGIVVVSYAKKR